LSARDLLRLFSLRRTSHQREPQQRRPRKTSEPPQRRTRKRSTQPKAERSEAGAVDAEVDRRLVWHYPPAKQEVVA